MGSSSTQAPSGLSRNLTEVYLFLRSNAQQHTAATVEFGTRGDDKVALIGMGREGDGEPVSSHDKTPPSWINVLDEVNYELTRIKTRKAALRELQQKHLVGLDFNDEATASPEQAKINDLTEEITSIFAHCRRLIRLLEEAEPEKTPSHAKLRENVAAAVIWSLNELLHSYRALQSTYLRRLDARRENVDAFLQPASSQLVPYTSASSRDQAASPHSEMRDYVEKDEEELTIDQIQTIMENEHMTKEREREVMRISKSILEVNTLFKDLASLIVDQGTIIDRIDYNVEQSSIRIKSAYKSVQKAEHYQRDRKLKLIILLAGIVLVLMLLILLTKF